MKINKPRPFSLHENAPLDNGLIGLNGGDLNPRARLVDGRPIMYEPKRENRFIFTFPEVLHIPSWVVKCLDRPSIAFANNFQSNTQNWVPPRHEWNDIRVILHDPIGPSTTQTLYTAIREHTLSLRQHEFILETLDPVGAVVEKWRITGVVTSVNFGHFDYASDDLAEIELVIKPYRCLLLF